VGPRIGLGEYEEATIRTTLVPRIRARDIVAVEKPCVLTIKIVLDNN